jgi:hypothetical protein
MGNGIFPDEATIYIAAANTNGSALVSSSDAVTGEVSNFSETGGEQDIDSIPVFGGGNIDKENPRTQIEVSFDIEMQYAPDNGDVTKWDSFKYGTGLTSATQGSKKSIALQWYNGTNYYTRFYNNCQGVSWSPGSGADGNLKGTITFKASPTTTSGAANLKISAAAITSSVFNW